ncbi:nuclear transport factor 2 family protein [Dyadobacter jiangsuensis]
MSTPLNLLKAYLDNVQDTQAASLLFAEDGAIELPYLSTLGYPPRAQGPAEIKVWLDNVVGAFQNFSFSNLNVFIQAGDQVFAEYEVHTKVLATGKPFNQLYMGRLVARNGKIQLLRESLNTVVTQQAFSNE